MFVVVVAHFTDEEIEQGEGRAQSSKPSSMVLMRRGMVGRMWGGGWLGPSLEHHLLEAGGFVPVSSGTVGCP